MTITQFGDFRRTRTKWLILEPQIFLVIVVLMVLRPLLYYFFLPWTLLSICAGVDDLLEKWERVALLSFPLVIAIAISTEIFSGL